MAKSRSRKTAVPKSKRSKKVVRKTAVPKSKSSKKVVRKTAVPKSKRSKRVVRKNRVSKKGRKSSSKKRKLTKKKMRGGVDPEPDESHIPEDAIRLIDMEDSQLNRVLTREGRVLYNSLSKEQKEQIYYGKDGTNIPRFYTTSKFGGNVVYKQILIKEKKVDIYGLLTFKMLYELFFKPKEMGPDERDLDIMNKMSYLFEPSNKKILDELNELLKKHTGVPYMKLVKDDKYNYSKYKTLLDLLTYAPYGEETELHLRSSDIEYVKRFLDYRRMNFLFNKKFDDLVDFFNELILNYKLMGILKISEGNVHNASIFIHYYYNVIIKSMMNAELQSELKKVQFDITNLSEENISKLDEMLKRHHVTELVV